VPSEPSELPAPAASAAPPAVTHSTAGSPGAGPVPSGESVTDLLGALAYGELSAFAHLAADAELAPTLAGRAQMSAMAATEFGHHRRLVERLAELGVEPDAVMSPFIAALETYHSLTEPSTWLEAVVKAYVGDGMAGDFYREVAAFTDRTTAALIESVVVDAGRGEFAIREVQAALTADPVVAGRLALWARRLVGEAISQAQHVIADRDSLTVLLIQGGGDLAAIGGLLTRITDRHAERMVALGLDS
jgi:hypothetical protein